MFVYQFFVEDKEIIALLNVQSSQTLAPIELRGDRLAVATFQDWLEQQYGAFGHFIDTEFCTVVDLEAVALSPKATQYKPKRISGGELLEGAGSGTPSGVLT